MVPLTFIYYTLQLPPPPILNRQNCSLYSYFVQHELVVIVLELFEQLHPLSLELLLAQLALLHAVHTALRLLLLDRRG